MSTLVRDRRTADRTKSHPQFVMRAALALVALIVGWATCGSIALADPPYLEFVDGLRDRGYYDYALIYLDQLEDDRSVPTDISVLIPYERATTLIQSARSKRDFQTQLRELEQASESLQLFVSRNPDHPKVAQANSERGKILMGKAEALLLQAKSPSNRSKAKELRTDARDSILEARRIFTDAKDRYEQEWKSFGLNIPAEEKEKRAERDRAETRFMSSQLDLAQTIYLEAQTYPDDDEKRRGLLKEAAEAYADITERYRTMIAGLYAKLWRAKAFEEMSARPDESQRLDDKIAEESRSNLRRAEALYRELLENDVSRSSTAQQIKDTARMFYLIVRNHPLNGDHAIVVQEASDWLSLRRGKAAATKTALGVRWQRAIAFERLAESAEISPSERTSYLRSALQDASFINSYPGEYRDVSREMIQRLKALLGDSEKDPEDFDEAYGLANSLIKQIDPLRNQVSQAKNKQDRSRFQASFQAHLDETARILKLALLLAGESVDAVLVDRTRYLLAYVEYLSGRPYDAAVLGEYVGRHTTADKTKTDLPADAAYLALLAFVKLLDDVPNGQSDDFEIRQVRRVADLIVSEYPTTPKADDARMTLGVLFNQRDDSVEAAKWFSSIPSSSDRFAEGQLSAGQAFWNAYLDALAAPNEQRIPQGELDQLRQNARDRLTRGIEELDKTLPAGRTAPDNFVAAQLSLVQIENSDGNYQKAVDILTKGPRPITDAVAIEKGKDRPDKGIKSVAFASLAYRQLLRAYVGLQQIDPALTAMRELERIGGEGNTEVFVDLGRQIKEEVERLPEGAERDSVLSAFDRFLSKLSELKQGQTYSSLIWIAETYFGLARAVEGDKKSRYFDQAASAYQEILTKSGTGGFMPADREPGIRLRLAEVERVRKNYDIAYGHAKAVLKANPNALNGQVEAATILMNWGSDKASEKLTLAIRGDDSDPQAVVWGWGQIASRLQRMIESGRGTPDFEDQYLDARYNLTESARLAATAAGDPQARQKGLNRAKQQLLTFVATTPRSEISDEWWGKLDSLYGSIQRNLAGDPPNYRPEPLVPAQDFAPVATTTREPTESATGAANNPQTPTEPTVAPIPEGPNWLLVSLGVLVAFGVTGGVVFSSMKGGRRGRRRRSTVASAASTVSSGAGSKSKPSPKKQAPQSGRPAGKTQRPAKPSASKTEKPTGRTQSPKQGRPKRKPRPES
ncbi:hypothetical protein [Stratiformator vulcanicus]|uniref:Tetratricopeptide repeat protein n=1 Tax=Stratiformator vulcanicus TaxID=2527980 RepID=A0A517R5G8_9PLAN|nr:hypothetical protein [Stratiformator vulcanicus]QDT39146.1 hypothetical protein Pan189_35490 [Stratiformator vulcanicus]